MTVFLSPGLIGIAALFLAAPVLAQTTADGGMALSAVLAQVEEGGARTVYSADSHRRGWEVVSCEGRSRVCREDLIDGTTGAVRETDPEVVWTLPPEGALPASEIVAQIEAMNIGVVRELDFDDRLWEVEIRQSAGSRAEMKIDPMTGEVRRCEGRACP